MSRKRYVLPRIKLPYLIGRKFFLMKDRDGFGDRTWEDYLAFLINRENIKLTPTVGEQISNQTTEHLLGMWMNNLALNLPFIRYGDKLELKEADGRGHSIAELAENTIPQIGGPPPKSSAIVIGRGPSVFKNRYGKNGNHLDLLAKHIKQKLYSGKIFTTDGMLIECLKKNIVPDFTISVDGSPIIKKWYDHPLVKKYGSKIKAILPATINHEVYKTCVKNKTQVFWFNPMMDIVQRIESLTRLIMLLTKTQKNPKGLVSSQGGGNSGSAAWIMALELLKLSPICVIGLDLGYPEGTKLEDTPYFSSYAGKLRESPGLISKVYIQVYHPYFRTKATFDAVFYHYRQTFLEMQKGTQPWFRHYGGTINASEGGTLFGPNIKCMTFKEFLDKYKK